jgi:hypothetical protein
VMALQMGMEIYHGIESWSVGDVEGAWAHLQSVAINVGLAGAMGGAGYGVGKIPTANLSKWSDKLTQIILPNAQTRLWMPDLGPYECDVTFGPQVKPNALGQYLVDGKTWVRIDRHVYEQTFDPAFKAWRIKHPTDSTAYQPLLKHNDGGAWPPACSVWARWKRFPVPTSACILSVTLQRFVWPIALAWQSAWICPSSQRTCCSEMPLA